MATIDGPKYTGKIVIDLSDVQDELVNLAPGALKGARAEKEGIDKVLAELAMAMPTAGAVAEVHPAIYQRVLDETAAIEKLRKHEIDLEAALEACRETRGKKENNREDDLSRIANQVEEKAARGRNTDLLADFEETLKYKSLFADKAAKTRRKNEEAKEAPPAEPSSPPVA